MPASRIELNPSAEGIFNNLQVQIDKIFEEKFNPINKSDIHCNNTINQFSKHLANEFKSQKIVNFQDKHVESFVKALKAAGYASNYIKTSISDIQKFSSVADCKYNLSTSKEIIKTCNVENRSTKNFVDRAWNKDEINKFDVIATGDGRLDVVYAEKLGVNFGLRLEGIGTLSVRQIDNALKIGELTVKEKGGKVRAVPVTTPLQIKTLEELKEIAKSEGLSKDAKIFRDSKTLNLNKKTQQYKSVAKSMRAIQNYITKYRGDWQDKDRVDRKGQQDARNSKSYVKGELSAHGWRYTFGQNLYKELRKKMDKKKAMGIVSKILGHGRSEISLWYVLLEITEI